MSHGRPSALALAVALVSSLTLTGCLGVETTQEKSAAKAKVAGQRLRAAQEGVTVGKVNAEVKVELAAVVQDANGVAAVVRVKNAGPAQASLPMGITVSNAARKKLYANDVPGLDPSLTSVPALGAGQTTYWVNNQILVAGKAARVVAQVGAARAEAPVALPEITLSKLAIGRDEDGVYAKDEVRNASALAQKRLTVACVAVDGERVVAAGRAVVERLPPAAEAKKATPFTVFFIGDPKRAKLECFAPPTVLPEGTAK